MSLKNILKILGDCVTPSPPGAPAANETHSTLPTAPSFFKKAFDVSIFSF